MAKLFKIQAYVVDFNDDFNEIGSLEDYLVWRTQKYIDFRHLHITRTDLGEFYDEHPLNYIYCPESEFEKYFKEDDQC